MPGRRCFLLVLSPPSPQASRPEKTAAAAAASVAYAIITNTRRDLAFWTAPGFSARRTGAPSGLVGSERGGARHRAVSRRSTRRDPRENPTKLASALAAPQLHQVALELAGDAVFTRSFPDAMGRRRPPSRARVELPPPRRGERRATDGPAEAKGHDDAVPCDAEARGLPIERWRRRRRCRPKRIDEAEGDERGVMIRSRSRPRKRAVAKLLPRARGAAASGRGETADQKRRRVHEPTTTKANGAGDDERGTRVATTGRGAADPRRRGRIREKGARDRTRCAPRASYRHARSPRATRKRPRMAS
jgi:hypothetical protein